MSSARCIRGLASRPVVFCCGVALLVCSPSQAALEPGQIVVSAEITTGQWGLLLIDPATGNRSIFSDGTHGAGVEFARPQGITVAGDGSLLVADFGGRSLQPDVPDQPPRIFRVDPLTGDRTVISQMATESPTNPIPAIGTGSRIDHPEYVRQEGNRLLATSYGLVSIDPLTGDRTLVSGTTAGSGPALDFTVGFLLSGNAAFVVNQYAGLIRVDLATGDRTMLSGSSVGNGPGIGYGVDAVTYQGDFYLSSLAAAGIVRVDLATGDRTVVTSNTVGSGPIGDTAALAMAVAPGGTLLLTVGPDAAHAFNGLLTVDPLSGDRAFLSDATHGSGPLFNQLVGVATIPLRGDVTGDGIVNVRDLQIVGSHWNHTGYFLPGDDNNDGVVNAQDIALVASHWLETAHRLDSGGAYAVPEPSAWIATVTGILGWLAFARRRAG